MLRDTENGLLRINDVDSKVTLVGWVNKRRNFGSLVFIDLRDRSGLVQLVFNENLSQQIKDVRNEYILQVEGLVKERKDKNPAMPTGDIEIEVESVKVINSAQTTPIIVADQTDALEDTRLKYRYLDLRRKPLQNNLIIRHRMMLDIRNYLSIRGFIEIETPILCRSTPEGARDYLVPSRISKGEFYALHQSPQLYKQLLMVGGMEKYFQIARCFRDEDLRADRQPEFTQVDIEMSFINEEDIFEVVEGLMNNIFEDIKGIKLTAFKRIKYLDAMRLYGSDKPDTRFEMLLNDVSSLFENTEFGVFKTVLDNNGKIMCLVVKDAANQYSRKKLDELQEYAKKHGAKALANLKYLDDEFSGSIAKVISDDEKTQLKHSLNLANNDLILFVADQKRKAQTVLGALRVKLGHDLNLIDNDKYNFIWVVEFPMFDYSEEEGRFVAAHHPFTAPKDSDIDKLKDDKANCMSRAYDLVLNGYELLSGSIRIHDQEMQKKVFEAIGLSEQQANDKFGWFVEAFKYGTPPHGGVGIGLDRLTMILSGTDNIRDVIAFPKTASASDLMSEAPSPVDSAQLDELNIKIFSDK